MNIVTLSIASREEVSRRAAAAFRGEDEGAHVSFESVDLLWNTLARKRWEILRAMTCQGALSIREVARRVGRDVKAVHGDVTASSKIVCSGSGRLECKALSRVCQREIEICTAS